MSGESTEREPGWFEKEFHRSTRKHSEDLFRGQHDLNHRMTKVEVERELESKHAKAEHERHVREQAIKDQAVKEHNAGQDEEIKKQGIFIMKLGFGLFVVAGIAKIAWDTYAPQLPL